MLAGCQSAADRWCGMTTLVRRPQPGDVVRWGKRPWRIRSLILAPATSVVLDIIGRRDSLRIDPAVWARVRWDDSGRCWRLPAEASL
jgi:hypothetical protein